MALQKSAVACRSQICHEGPAEAILEILPVLADGDCLRGLAGLSNAPVIKGLASTAGADRYNHDRIVLKGEKFCQYIRKEHHDLEAVENTMMIQHHETS